MSLGPVSRGIPSPGRLAGMESCEAWSVTGSFATRALQVHPRCPTCQGLTPCHANETFLWMSRICLSSHRRWRQAACCLPLAHPAQVQQTLMKTKGHPPLPQRRYPIQPPLRPQCWPLAGTLTGQVSRIPHLATQSAPLSDLHPLTAPPVSPDPGGPSPQSCSAQS